jgi:hypothetical protein
VLLFSALSVKANHTIGTRDLQVMKKINLSKLHFGFLTKTHSTMKAAYNQPAFITTFSFFKSRFSIGM